MPAVCDHPVGYIPDELIKANDWNKRLIEFAKTIDEFNECGQSVQIEHPGYVSEFNYCPECGQRLDRVALGLLTFDEAFVVFTAHKRAHPNPGGVQGATNGKH
ncbi:MULTISPECIES: hypothetical protein [Pseudomonas]|uniref:hypothetical protein n=1 Tax=Pseudomonas TaxID=286 RepID=UPI00070A2399|nr:MULTISPECIES: hypothetical protein [Pseudomonas]KQW19752.1 hypothetical protein ASC85_07835 [Pseudomonas sp. Root401]WHS57329.1 hypothetical protein QLH64_30395 [Pseudomonas brassicacearum]WNZ87588.1 hypothetical protein QOM10_30340 [Pseudomonas sp. P108]